MNENDLLIGKLYELLFKDSRKKMIVSHNGTVVERISSQETFVLLDVRGNPYNSLFILEILTSSGNVGMTAVYLEEIKMVN